MSRFTSIDPATGGSLWEGDAADEAQCAAAIASARAAFPAWAALPDDARRAILLRYNTLLTERTDAIARAIARETGKPLWEAQGEVASMVGKVDISITAQTERAGTRAQSMGFGQAVLRHRPHGVMAVLGPYNFPGHLPNGHIVPALLAGNCVIFKPSELTPLVGEMMAAALHDAGVPQGVFTLLQGGRDTGAALIAQDIDGLLFTGSAGAGMHFRKIMADRPHVMLALELGGNNPLIAWDGEAEAVASIIVQSAFITAGQRCSCARRLIVQQGATGDAIVAATVALAARLRVGAWDDADEPYMGPLISDAAASHALSRYDALVTMGAQVIVPLTTAPGRSAAFLSSGIVDVTGVAVPDEEIFAPLLQIVRVADFDAAITAANNTAYGLAAGLISQDDDLWDRFSLAIRAGVVNRNRPTTGASGAMPFGGLGASGNHRPSAFYAADYCAYPVASFEASQISDQRGDMRGLT
ncbi:MAG: succinylglutamate-semialdehyde dehydrogenase [Sphingomonadaceae bacterium]|nr:succinylglutamate-semialdehyde dehydrogenase [Sphingomonadaceae bacterium]